MDVEIEEQLNGLMLYLEDQPKHINMNSYFDDSGYKNIVDGDIGSRVRAFRGYLRILKYDELSG